MFSASCRSNSHSSPVNSSGRNSHPSVLKLSICCGVSFMACPPDVSLCPVRGLAGAAVEHAHLFFGHGLVEGHRLRLEIALRDVFGLKMPVGVLAAHQRCPVALADGLLEAGRNVADGESDAAVV